MGTLAPAAPGVATAPRRRREAGAAWRWRLAGRPFFFWLTVAGAIAAYVTITAGAVVRVTGSGLGCPDWPTCHGRLVPPLEAGPLIEYAHRLAAAVTSALIFAVPAVAWLWHRKRRFLLPATLVPVLLAIQIALGAVVVWLELPAFVVLVHLGFAMLILGAMVWLAAWVAPGPVALGAAQDAPGIGRETSRRAGRGAGGGETSQRAGRDHYRALVSATAGLTLFLVLTGAFTRATGASWACAGFPGCAVPQEAVQAAEAGGVRGLVQIHLFHRATAYLVAVLTLASIGETWRLRRTVPALRRVALLLAGCLAAQIAIGAAAATFGLPVVLRGAHVAGAAATWGAVVLLAALAWRGQVSSPTSQVPRLKSAAGERDTHPSPHARPGTSDLGPRTGVGSGGGVGVGAKALALLSMTKPRVILLLEVPTLAAMLIAGEGWPAPLLVGATLLGGALAAGGAAAINAYLDRDIDALMGSRTQRRPIPAGTVRPGEALAFGLALAVASFAVLLVFANLLAAVLAQVALLFYVFVYTRWLKRSTPSNIVIGGAAGAIPPLVGWAAVTGSLGPTAWLLFAIIFFWTPPHFWALSLLLQQHYARAGVPMLPVVRGADETRRQIIYYTLQLIAVTVFVFTFGLSGLFYLGAALGLGGIFLYLAWRLWQEASAPAARRLFHYSMLYLWLLCAALVVDQRFF